MDISLLPPANQHHWIREVLRSPRTPLFRRLDLFSGITAKKPLAPRSGPANPNDKLGGGGDAGEHALDAGGLDPDGFDPNDGFDG